MHHFYVSWDPVTVNEMKEKLEKSKIHGTGLFLVKFSYLLRINLEMS